MDIVSWPDWARCSLTFVQDFNLCAFVCVCLCVQTIYVNIPIEIHEFKGYYYTLLY